MGKIIFWIVVVFVVLFALRLVNSSKAKRRARESGADEKKPPVAETMVARALLARVAHPPQLVLLHPCSAAVAPDVRSCTSVAPPAALRRRADAS